MTAKERTEVFTTETGADLATNNSKQAWNTPTVTNLTHKETLGKPNYPSESTSGGGVVFGPS
ncbi:Uncharacterised protein [BD1-7 clade bacterium]|uniref:Uncharacterized protein n=1 Tax=BD1-7 clade bacterium TaxID=2029982 RepID=A0A5S9PGD2_9GAMM|nr:Uncharacterised protein [BD1-7 clade bacterium]CAA0103202.1 Uncharacterised protein [BD1-7 clade bacterium]